MSLIAVDYKGIRNPALSDTIGSNAGGGGSAILAKFIVTLWYTLLTLGGLAVLVFILMGGVSWITAGGDEKKIENARNKITQALIGMLILFASIAFVNWIGPAIGFDLLKLNFPSNLPTN